jgi:hypothetical protein
MSEIDILKYDNKLLKEQVAYLKEKIDPFKLDIRDHFAGLAMQSLINVYVNTGNEMVTDDRYLAAWAYKKADAMLAEREKEK